MRRNQDPPLPSRPDHGDPDTHRGLLSRFRRRRPLPPHHHVIQRHYDTMPGTVRLVCVVDGCRYSCVVGTT